MTDTLEVVSKLKELSTGIVEHIATTLLKIRKSNLEIGMKQVDGDFASLQDPADHPRTLSDQQKQGTIENGPFELWLVMPRLVEALSRMPWNPNKKTVQVFKQVVSGISPSRDTSLDEKNPLLPGLMVLKDGIK